MPYELYPWGLVKRYLENWGALSEGRYPLDYRAEAMPGYRGKQYQESAPFEAAIIAYVDLCAAVARLPPYLRHDVMRRYWFGKRSAGRSATTLVDAVWREMNR